MGVDAEVEEQAVVSNEGKQVVYYMSRTEKRKEERVRYRDGEKRDRDEAECIGDVETRKGRES